jgi:hypothetical protein
MRDQRSTTRPTPQDDATLATWAWLAVATLVVLPIVGVFAALVALDVTRSFPAHVAVAAMFPAAGATVLAGRFGASSGLVVRLALMAALAALVMLDLGWSGLPT